MICPQTCLLRPTPKDPHRPFEIAQGLGLVRDLVVEVHFPLSREGLAGSALLKGMMRTRTAQGLGLASTGCAVLEDGRLVRVLGEGVFRVQMTAFDPCLYEVERIAPG
jgi:cyanophycinase-like exopeptidase